MQIEVSASEIKSKKKADDRGRVTLGSEYARETVTVAVLEVKDEDDVRTDGGRSAGNPETRLGEARKQLRIVLDDVEFEDEDEDTAKFVEGALACAESAAVCLEGEDALDGEPSITDAPVPMVKSVGPLGTTILGPEPGAYQAWQNRRDGGDGR